MAHSKLYFEIFEEFEKASKREDKIAVLRNYGNQDRTLLALLIGTFHPDVKYKLVQVPPYKASDAPAGMGYTSINQEIQRVYLFQDQTARLPDIWRPQNPRIGNLPARRLTEILIQILENLEAKEAEVFISMLLKKSPAKGLTAKIVNEAFPGLLPQ
jgi:hypothetical protein